MRPAPLAAVRAAVEAALAACALPAWRAWARAWLSGADRSAATALAARELARWAVDWEAPRAERLGVEAAAEAAEAAALLADGEPEAAGLCAARAVARAGGRGERIRRASLWPSRR